MTSRLTIDMAVPLAEIAIANVTREFPNKLDHVLTGPTDVKGPRALHPIFYGSFDWHSCVHAYWVLARLGWLVCHLSLQASLPISSSLPPWP